MKLSKYDYNRIHKWNLRNWVKAGTCEHCQQLIKTDWANKSGAYKEKDRSDWLELCRKCHAKYDGFGAKPGQRKCQVCGVRTRKPKVVYGCYYKEDSHKLFKGRNTVYCAKCYKRAEYVALAAYPWYTRRPF